MSEERNLVEAQLIAPTRELTSPKGTIYCSPTSNGHCITCSDEALQVRVLSVDGDAGVALVELGEGTEEVDVSLVEEVAPGDLLLVHGGVAIAAMKKANGE